VHVPFAHGVHTHPSFASDLGIAFPVCSPPGSYVPVLPVVVVYYAAAPSLPTRFVLPR
jgi:hypothetical protein